jgi:hypothetical protein
MTFQKAFLVAIFGSVALVALLVAGCGSSSSSSSSSEAVGSTAPSAAFMRKGGSNKPATFGAVASDEEREAASKVLEENLEARATGDWAVQCATLTASRAEHVEIYAAGEGCAAAMKVQAEPFAQSKEIRSNTMTGPIDVLRVKGDEGYALYHGKGGQDYAMPMEKEDGEWKVARLATNEVP